MLEYYVVAIKRQITYKTYKKKYFVSTLSFYDDCSDGVDGNDASGDGRGDCDVC